MILYPLRTLCDHTSLSGSWPVSRLMASKKPPHRYRAPPRWRQTGPQEVVSRCILSPCTVATDIDDPVRKVLKVRYHLATIRPLRVCLVARMASALLP